MENRSKVEILIVDDHPENLLALEAILNSPDYRLVKAHSGEEALKHLLYGEFAVILLDVHMPGMDGFETALLIKEREKSRHTPIIFLTAISKTDPQVFKGYSVGAVDYVFKPFEPEVLRSKVTIFAELFNMNQRLKRQTETLKRQAELLRLSEQRERQRALLELEQTSLKRYRNLADAIPQIVWTARPDGEVDYYNQRWFDYTGMTLEQSVGLGWKTALHPEDLQGCIQRWKNALDSGKVYEMEYRVRRFDGIYRWHLARALPERDAREGIIAWLGTCTDIDDQKRTEEALSAEKERLSTTLRSIGDGVITTNTGGNVILINNVVEALTGWTQEEAFGKPLEEVFHIVNEKTRKRCESPVAKVLRTGQVVELANHTALVARDGTQRSIADSGAPIRDQDGRIIGVVLVFRDVTEKQKMEGELFKASKLESIGLLAGGIAHDFNNILTAIMGNISLAKMAASKEKPVVDRLIQAEKASLRAREMTQQLLTFSKGGKPIRQVASLVELIKESAGFGTGGSNVRCEFSLPNDLWPAEIDGGQIGQVIQNLVINAKQAMPQGGVVGVSGENITLGEQSAIPLPNGRYIRISVKDHGIGIPEENLDKIFDPFFTTKPTGTGLGLTSSFSIVKKHDGHMTVDSKAGSGAAFSVYLPASLKEVAEVKKEAEELKPGDGGKILIMDNEESVREVVADMLAHLGYEVHVCKDGAEAIAKYEEAKRAGQPFDLVVMDLTIPGGMGGKEAIQKLIQIDPQVKAVVSSGYSDDPVMAQFKEHGFSGVILKPFKFEDFHKVIWKTMRTSEGAA